jgi:hypothetical protein
MINLSHPHKKTARTFTMLIVATALLLALLSSSATVDAKGERKAVFGTAVTAAASDSIDVATRDGIITLIINDETKIDSKKHRKKFDKVSAGDSVTGYYTEDEGVFTAIKLSFKPRKPEKKTRHVVGVVVDKDDDTLTVLTPEGETVEVTPTDDPDNDPTEPGSLIITVVEEDIESGDLDAAAVVTAKQTIARLNEAIDHDITLAQSNLLKIRMSETASIHLTQLYETLDDIKAEAKAKIEAAFNEFQTNYTETLEENLLEPPLINIAGLVLQKSATQIVVRNDGGQRSFIQVPTDVQVELLDGSTGVFNDVNINLRVDVSATPQTTTSSPVARIIRILPIPESPDNSGENDTGANGNDSDDTLVGTIVVVTPSSDGTHTIIVVANSDGPDTATAITESTILTGDGELLPDVNVEVTLESDGFTASEVVILVEEETLETATPIAVEPPIVEATATAIAAATPTETPAVTPAGSSVAEATPEPPKEYILTGKIRSFSVQGITLDDVYLDLGNISPTDDSFTVGEEIQFTVVINESGQWVVVGIAE